MKDNAMKPFNYSDSLKPPADVYRNNANERGKVSGLNNSPPESGPKRNPFDSNSPAQPSPSGGRRRGR